MTQVTGVQEFFEAMVEVCPAGGAWTDISGWGATVAVSGRERQVGEGFTHDGDRAIVGHGKLQPLDVTVRAIYTEGGLDPYAIVLPALENHTVLQVRWSPYGGQTGEKKYTTNVIHSHVTNCPAPSGEAGSGDPVMLEFTVRTSDIVESNPIGTLSVHGSSIGVTHAIGETWSYTSAPAWWRGAGFRLQSPGAYAGGHIQVTLRVDAGSGTAISVKVMDSNDAGNSGVAPAVVPTLSGNTSGANVTLTPGTTFIRLGTDQAYGADGYFCISHEFDSPAFTFSIIKIEWVESFGSTYTIWES